MYQIFTDKTEKFSAQIKLAGASLKKSFCRLVLESADINLVFNGTIDPSGKVSIPIKRVKNILDEGTRGKLKLEVIAEDTYFVPWNSEFEVKTAKSVQVEVATQLSGKPIMEATVEVKPSNRIVRGAAAIPGLKSSKKNLQILHLKLFMKELMKENITFKNMSKNKDKITKISNDMLFEHNLSEDSRRWIVRNALKMLMIKHNQPIKE